MKKVSFLVAVLVVAVAIPVFAFGPGGFGGGPGGAGWGGPGYAKCGYGPGFHRGGGGPGGFGGGQGMAAYLNLSKEQMDKMWQIKDKYRNDMRQTRYQLYQKRLEARKIFTDPKADDGTILAKQKEISALQQKMQEKMVQMKLEERKVLTPEQLQKLNEAPRGYGHGHGREGRRGQAS